MSILYFDCFSGISGDMTLGALLDLDVDRDAFLCELAKLNLSGYKIEIEKTIKHAITGTDVHVILDDENDDTHHEQEHCHEDRHETHHHEHRSLRDIEKIIDGSALKESVKESAKKVFREIARAEGKVHGLDMMDVHFHEIGAVDSIVDIVGVCICLELLGADEIYASELHEGRGFVSTQHGRLPIPVPAVMEMLGGSGIPLITENISCELITPTGIGLIKTIAKNFGAMPSICVEKNGYGFGKRETGKLNALRIVMGTALETEKKQDVIIMETNIDDMTPEALGYVMQKLFEQNALDVWFTPIYMKKNRLATKLSVLANEPDVGKIEDLIFAETTTIGVRKMLCDREVMARKTYVVQLTFGDVRVKVSARKNIEKISPEYEDCKKIAAQNEISIMEVYEMVKEKFRHDHLLRGKI